MPPPDRLEPPPRRPGEERAPPFEKLFGEARTLRGLDGREDDFAPVRLPERCGLPEACELLPRFPPDELRVDFGADRVCLREELLVFGEEAVFRGCAILR